MRDYKEILKELEELEKEYDKKREKIDEELCSIFSPLLEEYIEYSKFNSNRERGMSATSFECFEQYIGYDIYSDYGWSVPYESLTREHLDNMKKLYLIKKEEHEKTEKEKKYKEYLKLKKEVEEYENKMEK
jgi:hypothetical protein